MAKSIPSHLKSIQAIVNLGRKAGHESMQLLKKGRSTNSETMKKQS